MMARDFALICVCSLTLPAIGGCEKTSADLAGPEDAVGSVEAAEDEGEDESEDDEYWDGDAEDMLDGEVPDRAKSAKPAAPTAAASDGSDDPMASSLELRDPAAARSK